MNSILAFVTFMITVIPCAIAQGGSSEVDYYTPANILRFAEHLYESGDYLRAAGEYQRYLLYSSQSDNHDQVTYLYRIAQCYQLGGQPEQVIQTFEKLLAGDLNKNKKDKNDPLSTTIRPEIGYAYFLMERYETSLSYLENAFNQTADFNERWKLKQLVGFNYLKQHRWSEAKHLFDLQATTTVDDELIKKALQLKQYAINGGQLSHKNPYLAGFLSTIVPGLGKVYSNRLHDGVFSFFTIGFISWLAYDGFHKDGLRSVKGWFFAPVDGVFYLGNIYGSIIAAKIHNRDIERDFIETIPFDIFDIP